MSGSVSQLMRVNQAYRVALRANEVQAVATLGKAYAAAWEALGPRVAALTTQIDELIADDDNRDDIAYKLYREARYQELQRQLAIEMTAIEDVAEGVITQQQQTGVRLGRQGAIEQIRAVYGQAGIDQLQLTRLPNEALRDLIGFTQDGSPLRRLLDDIGLDASQRIRTSLIEGIALGENPRVVARRMQDAFGGNLSRAMTVARTELLRAARTTTQRWGQENRDIVAEWVWMSALSDTSCLSCVAMHGQRFPIDEPFASHPGCRCNPALLPPRSRIPDMMQSGEEWFAEIGESVQYEMLGPGAFEAYKAGEVQLRDFVGERYDPQWGLTRSQKSFTAVVGAKQAQEWRMAAD